MKHGSKHNYSNNNNNNNDGDDDNNDVLIKRDLKAMSTGDAKSLPGNQQSDCGQTSRCNDLPVNGPSITSLSKTSVSEQCKQSNLVHSSVDDVIGATTPTRTTPSLPSPRPSSTDVVVNDDDYDEEEACDTPTSLSPSHSVTPSGTPSRATPGLPATPGSGSGSASSLSMATNRPAQTSSAYGAARAFAAAASGVSVTARCPPVREAVDPAKYITLSGDLDGVKYACSKCGNVYKWRKSLNKHWKEKHDGETPDPPGSSSAAARLAIATQHQQQLHGSTIGHHSQLSPSDGHGKHGVLSMISNGRSIYGGRTLTAIKTSPDAANLTSVVGSAAAASRHLKGSLAALNPSLFSKFTLNPRSTSRIGSQHQQQNSPLGVSGVAPSWSPHHPPVVEGMLKVPDFLGVSVAASGGAKLSSDLLRSPSYDMGQGQGQLDASGAASVPHRSEKPVDLSESSRPYRRPAMTNDGGDETDVLDLSKKNNDHVSGQWSVTPPVADELFAVQDEPLDFSTKVVSGGGGSSTVVNGFASAASLSRASSAAALGGQQHQQLFLASARFPQLDNVAPLSSVTRDVAAVDFVDRKFDVGTSSCAQCHVKFTSPAELNRHFSREHADVLHTMASDRRQPPGCSTGSAQLYRYLTNETPLPAPIMAHHGGGAGSDSTSCVVCGKWLLSRALASKHFDEQHSILGPNNPYRPSALQQAHSSAMSRLDIDEPPRKKTILDGRMNHVRSDSFSAYATGNQLHQGSPGLAMAGRMNGGGAVHAVDDFKSDLLLSQCDDEQTAIVIPQAPEDASSLMASGSVAPATSKIYISTAHQQQQQQQQPPQVPVNVRVGTGTAGRSRRAELLGLTASGSPASATGGSTAAAEALLPFKCPLCEYRARWPSEMTQHAKNHSDEKPFRCPQCSYRSKWKWDVVKHLKRCGGGNCTARDVIDMSASPMNGGGSGAGAVSNLASLTSGTSSTSTQRRRRFHTPSNRSVLLNAAAIQHQQLQHSQILQQHPQNVATVLPEQRNGPVQATENLDPRSSTSGFHNKQEAVLSGPSQVADRDMGEESGGNQSISSPNNHALKAAPEVKSELVPGEQLSTAAATHATPCNEASQTSVAGQFGQGLHYCGQCPFVGHSPAELRRHQRVHSDEKPYSCRTCSYSSKWKCDLKKHLRAYNHVSAVPLVYGGHGRKPSLPADWGLGRIGLADPRDLVGLVRDSDFFDQSFTSDSAAATGDGHAEGGSDSGRSTDDRSGAGRGRHQQGTGNGLAAGITTGGRLRCRRCDFEAVDITSFLQHKTIQHSGHQSAEQRVRDNVEIVGNSDMCHQTTSGAVTMESTSGGQHHHRRKSSKQIRVLPTSQSDEIDQNVGPEVRRTAAATSTELSATDEDHKLKKQNWDDVCDEDRFWKSLGLKCKNKDGRKPLAGILNCQSEIASGSTSVSGLTVRDQSGWNAGRLSASEEVASAVGSPAIGTPQLDDMIDCDNRSSVSGNTSGTDEMDVDYMEVDDSSRTSANGSRMNAVDGWSEPVDLCSRNVAHGDDHEHSGNTSPTGSQQQHPGSSCTASAVSTAPVRRHWSWSKGIEGCTWRTSLNGSSGPGSSGSAEAEDAASMSRRKRKLRTCDKCGYVTDNLTTLQRHTAKHGSTGELNVNMEQIAQISKYVYT
jgi:DNA-directed RNA polymerase subunit M/transcription elongation factor TFIIS